MISKSPVILMIDDDKHLLEIYKARLEKEGFKVLLSESGDKALQMLLKLKPDLITLDIVMPGKDGIETLKLIKEVRATANIPVLMLSTLSDKGYIKKALDLGAIEYLLKAHAKPGDLITKIKAVLHLT